tara:strand:+ start:607 stop:1986 length:1380 start_codon:yes stop_codon:yes gene_type:complete
MSSINTDNLEDFYTRLSKGQDKYAFYLGGVSEGSNYDTAAGDRNVWEDVSLLYHVRKNDAKPVVRRINYEIKKTYNPWRATGNSSADNYYVLNQTNGTVYLCVSSNALNRIDQFGDNNSTYTPSFEDAVEKTYPDGYRWRRLYKLDTNSRRFLTDNLMPVNDAIKDFEEFPTVVGLQSLITYVCSNGGDEVGSCGLYPRTKQYVPEDDTYITAGFLWEKITDVSCYRCYDLAQRLDMEHRFVAGAGSLIEVPSSISLETNLEKINSLQLNPNSNEKVQAELVTSSSAKDGEILSMFINLANLSYSDRQISVENPEIVITSATGTGASARLITFKDNAGNIVVDGIELISGGSGYYEYGLTIPSVTGASTFINLIETNIEPLDGFATSTRKLLNATQLAFKVEFDSNDILDADVEQKTFTTYGILKNPQTTDDVVFGSDLNKNEKKIERNTIKINLNLDP